MYLSSNMGKNNFYLSTHYRNLIFFYSFGYIIPRHIMSNYFKYYSLIYNHDMEMMLCEKFPDTIEDDMAVIELVNFEENNISVLKNDLKEVKSQKGYINLRKFIPLTTIKMIFLTSQRQIDSLLQLEFSNNISFNSEKFSLNPILKRASKVGGEQIEFVVDSEPKDIKTSKISKGNMLSFFKFQNRLAVHLIFSNYAMNNNIYDKSIDKRIPSDFATYSSDNFVLEKLLIALKQFFKEFYNGDIKISQMQNIANSSNGLFDTKEVMLWASVLKFLYEYIPEFRTEESDKYYIDNVRVFQFKEEDLIYIGKTYKVFLENYISETNAEFIVEEFHKDNALKHRVHPDSDNYIKILGFMKNKFFELDFESENIIKMINGTKNPLFIKVSLMIHDLIRYGKDVSLFSKKLLDLSNEDFKSDPINLMQGILLSLFIGTDRLPNNIKSGNNFNFLWNSFVDSQVLTKEKVVKIKDALYWPDKNNCVASLSEINSSKKYLKYDNKIFEILFDSIKTTKKEGRH